MLSETGQSQRHKYYMILFIGGSKVVKLRETESRMVVARVRNEKEWGVTV